jgi:hypothetical protein
VSDPKPSVAEPLVSKSAFSEIARSSWIASLPGYAAAFILIMLVALLAPAFAQVLACTSCHGPEAKRIASPDCGSCHVGTALHVKGQLRFDNLFDGDVERKPVDNTFVVNQGGTYNTSVGHGGLKCAACHGDPHTQHTRVAWDCIQCHKMQLPKSEGPHGMHLAGESWVRAHGLQVDENGAASCTGCHGPDGRGTVLSQAFADRTFDTKFGRKQFAKGTAVGCYSCHLPSGAAN